MSVVFVSPGTSSATLVVYIPSYLAPNMFEARAGDITTSVRGKALRGGSFLVDCSQSSALNMSKEPWAPISSQDSKMMETLLWPLRY